MDMYKKIIGVILIFLLFVVYVVRLRYVQNSNSQNDRSTSETSTAPHWTGDLADQQARVVTKNTEAMFANPRWQEQKLIAGIVDEPYIGKSTDGNKMLNNPLDDEKKIDQGNVNQSPLPLTQLQDDGETDLMGQINELLDFFDGAADTEDRRLRHLKTTTKASAKLA